jgi:hypothetical protein
MKITSTLEYFTQQILQGILYTESESKQTMKDRQYQTTGEEKARK